MSGQVVVLSVEQDSDDGILVNFSDGTTAGYVVEELLELRPHRELTRLPSINVDWSRTEPIVP